MTAVPLVVAAWLSFLALVVVALVVYERERVRGERARELRAEYDRAMLRIRAEELGRDRLRVVNGGAGADRRATRRLQ